MTRKLPLGSQVFQKEFFPATAMPDKSWWSVLWPNPDSTIRTLRIKAEMTVVDLCCGDGHFTAPLAELVNGKVYALDIDQEMLNQARSEVARRGASVIEWLCADARDIADLIPHEIDYVLIANTFHGVPDKTALAQTVARVLKPGGLFAIVNWHRLPREQTTATPLFGDAYRRRSPATGRRQPPSARPSGPADPREAFSAHEYKPRQIRRLRPLVGLVAVTDGTAIGCSCGADRGLCSSHKRSRLCENSIPYRQCVILLQSGYVTEYLFQLLALISNIVTHPGRQTSFHTVWFLIETQP